MADFSYVWLNALLKMVSYINNEWIIKRRWIPCVWRGESQELLQIKNILVLDLESMVQAEKAYSFKTLNRRKGN